MYSNLPTVFYYVCLLLIDGAIWSPGKIKQFAFEKSIFQIDSSVLL